MTPPLNFDIPACEAFIKAARKRWGADLDEPVTYGEMIIADHALRMEKRET